MATDRTIQLAEKLLGKPLAEGALNSEDGTIAELILMELAPQLNTGEWSSEMLMGAFELLAFQSEQNQQQQNSDSFDDDAELFSRVLSQHQSNATKPLSSSKEQYVRK